jgi:peptide/nickel transport system permease protein
MAAVVFQELEVTPQRRAWRRLLRRGGALFGLSVVLFFVAIALLAPVARAVRPAGDELERGARRPEAAHPFGSDELGRDVLSRIIWGARASLLAGLVSVSISLALGVPIGMAAGYLGAGRRAHLAHHRRDARLPVPDPRHRARLPFSARA